MQDPSPDHQEFEGNNDIVQQEDENESKRIGEHPSESFLDMRPEPPPPPDIVGKEDPPDPPVPHAPDTPRSLPEAPKRHSAELRGPDPMASPTAVPFDFRFSRPRPPFGSSRSLSQIPFSPSQTPTGQAPRPKVRPRSTEFTSSKEFRPLMLVERHNSHSEAPPGETYPSLPSSHTTSRASSVYDDQENDRDRNQEMYETGAERLAGGHGMTIETEHSDVQPDLLDSQQTTPTASSFQHAGIGTRSTSQLGNEDSSPPVKIHDSESQSSALRDVALGTLLGASAASIMHTMHQEEQATGKELPVEERDQFEQGLADMALEPLVSPQRSEDAVLEHKDMDAESYNIAEDSKVSQEAQEQLQPDHITLDVDPAQMQRDEPVNDNPPITISEPQDRSSISQQETSHDEKKLSSQQMDLAEEIDDMESIQPRAENDIPENTKTAEDYLDSGSIGIPTPLAEESPYSKLEDEETSAATASNTLMVEKERQFQEEDTQGAVDSWFAPVSSSKKKKRNKKQGPTMDLPESGELIGIALDNSVKDLENEQQIGPEVEDEPKSETSVAPSMNIANLKTHNADDPRDIPSSDTPASIQGPNASLLERRQSKSKAKKGKKSKKSTLQTQASPPMTPAIEEVNNIMSEPRLESSSAYRNVRDTNNLPLQSDDRLVQEIIAPEKESHPEGPGLDAMEEPTTPLREEVPPELVPLPDESDLGIDDGDFPAMYTTETTELSQLGTTIAASLNNHHEQDDSLRLKEETSGLDRSETHRHESVDIGSWGMPEPSPSQTQHTSGPHEVDIDSSRSAPDQRPKENPIIDPVYIPENQIEVPSQVEIRSTPPPDVISRNTERESNSEAEFPERQADETMQELDTIREPEALQEPTIKVSEQPQEAGNMEDENWEGFSSKKKKKKGKKGKTLSMAEIEAGAEADTIPSTTTILSEAGDGDSRIAASFVPEVSEPVTEDEGAHFGKKKKGKKGKRLKESFTPDISIDVTSDDRPNDSFVGKIQTVPEDTAAIPAQGSYRTEDDHANHSSEQRSTKSLKIDFPVVEPALTLDTPIVDAPEASEQNQTEINDQKSTEQSTPAEPPQDDEWAGFSSKKKSKKKGKGKTNYTGEVETDVSLADKPQVKEISDVDPVNDVRQQPPEQSLPPRSEQPEDEWTGFASKKKSKKSKKSKSKALDLGPEITVPEPHPGPFEQADQVAQDETQETTVTKATTSTTQGVNAILGSVKVPESGAVEQQGSHVETIGAADREPSTPGLELPAPDQSPASTGEERGHIDTGQEAESQERESQEVIPQEADPNQAEIQEAEELEIIDRYTESDTPSRPLTEEGLPSNLEGQELELIDQYNSEADATSKNGTAAAMTNTAEEVKALLQDESTAPVSSNELQAAEVAVLGEPKDLQPLQPQIESDQAVEEKIQSPSATLAARDEETLLPETGPEAPAIGSTNEEPSRAESVKETADGTKGPQIALERQPEPQIIEETMVETNASQPALEDESEALAVEEDSNKAHASIQGIHGRPIQLPGTSFTVNQSPEILPQVAGSKAGLVEDKTENGMTEDGDVFDEAIIERPLPFDLSKNAVSPDDFNVHSLAESLNTEDTSIGQQIEDQEPERDLPRKKKGKKGKRNNLDVLGDVTTEGTSSTSTSAPESQYPSDTPSQQTMGSFDHDDQSSKQPREAEWDVPKRKGKKSKKSTLSAVDLPDSGEPFTAVTPPAGLEISQAPTEPASADFEDLPSKKSRKDKKSKRKSAAVATNNDAAVVEPGPQESGPFSIVDDEDSKLGLSNEPSTHQIVEPLIGIKDKDWDNSTPQESLRQIRRADQETNHEDSLPPSDEQSNRERGKKAKRGKVLAWEDEAEAESGIVGKDTMLDPVNTDQAFEPRSENVDVSPYDNTDYTDSTAANPLIQESEGTALFPKPFLSSEPPSSLKQPTVIEGEDRPYLTDDIDEKNIELRPDHFHDHTTRSVDDSVAEIDEESSRTSPPRSGEPDVVASDSQVQPAEPEIDIEPSVEADMDPANSLKQSKKDKKKGKKTHSSLDDDDGIQEVPQRDRNLPTYEVETEPSIVPMPKDHSSDPNQASLVDEVRPSEVTDPDDRPLSTVEDTAPQSALTATEDAGSQSVTREEDFAPVTKSKKGKKSKKGRQPVPESEQDPLPLNEPTSLSTSSQQSREEPVTGNLIPATLSNSEIVPSTNADGLARTLETETLDPGDPEDISWELPVKKGKRSKKQQRKAALQDLRESEITEPAVSDSPEVSEVIPGFEISTRSPEDASTSTVAVGHLDPQEQATYDQEEHLKEITAEDVDLPRSSLAEVPSIKTLDEITRPDADRPLDPEVADEKEDGSHCVMPVDNTQESPAVGIDSQESPSSLRDQHPDVLLDNPSSTDPLKTSSLAEPQAVNRQDHNELYELGDNDALPTPIKDVPTPSTDVDLLDAQQQREYDNLYAKELERQLSPLGGGEGYAPPRNEMEPQSSLHPSIDSIMTAPLEERTPLARPPPLDDIEEESRSRSGSVQETPSNQESGFPPPLTSKKSKKGKKGKKQQQPIIWEDDTATPAVESEVPPYPEHDSGQDQDQFQKPLTGSPSVAPSLPILPTSNESRHPDQPIDLEEPATPQPLQEDRNAVQTDSLSRAPLGEQGVQAETDDYFTSRPDNHAEQDVGPSLEYDEFRESIPTILPSSIEEPSETVDGPVVTREPEISENLQGPAEAKSSDGTLTSEGVPISLEETNDDDFSYASNKKSKKGKKLKKKPKDDSTSLPTPDTEPSFDALATEQSPEKVSSLETDNLQDRSRNEETRYPTVPDTQTSTGRSEPFATVAGIAKGALAEESLSRRDSKKGGKKGKKGKNSTAWADMPEEIPSSGSPITENVATSMDTEQIRTPLGQEQTSREHSPLRTSQQPEDTLPTSPTRALSRYPASEVTTLPETDQTPNISTSRDSGINVSDSPLIPEDIPDHRIIRDSGYPETLPSPVPESEPVFEERRMETYPEVTQRAFEDSTSKSIHRPSSRSSPIGVEQEESTYEASFPEVKEKKRRSKSYDSDDSADSGFDVQRRRRRQAQASEARDPSPVSSTTKDRSSALFDSSPSAREEKPSYPSQEQGTSTSDRIHDEPTWSFARNTSPTARSPKTDSFMGDGTSSTSTRMPDPSTYTKLTGGQEEPPRSLFGGPVHHDEDYMSGSRSPPVSESRDRRRRLGTISEDSHERLSLHGKDKRTLSDVGSPEAGVKEPRVKSPTTDGTSLGYPSTEHSTPQPLGSSTDDGGFTNKSERGRGRDTARKSSRQSVSSELPTIVPRQSLGEHRTASVGSVQSDNSIHAIIRTPDQMRSASGQSYRSSGTPPLRRVDRSASGDLRGASKLGEAKLRAKTSEADLEPAINNIPSSSTYDPVTDKGKSRADMADVYVSTLHH